MKIINLGHGIQITTDAGRVIFFSNPVVPPSENPIDLFVSASITSGVAPLYVMFDTVGTSSVDEEKPFHSLDYYWDFNDASATFSGGDYGPLASHVFDQPGTYNVAVYARDINGNISTSTIPITVTDPDVIFSGTNTICISNDGDFTDAPAGCTQTTTSSVNVALAGSSWYGKRVLFKRGQTFTCSATISRISCSTETIIGAFGAKGTLGEKGIPDNNPIWSVMHNSTVVTIGDHNTSTICRNLRFCDILASYDNGGTSGHLFALDFTAIQLLLYRIKDAVSKPFNQVFSLGASIPDLYGTSVMDKVAIANCYLNNSRSYCGYIAGTHLAFINTHFQGVGPGAHCVRIPMAVRHTAAGCYFHVGTTSTHSYTIRGRDKLVDPTFPDTQYVVILDCDTTGGSAWYWTLASESTSHGEVVRDVIVDGCTFTCTSAYASPVCILDAAHNSTIRNCYAIIPDGLGLTQFRFSTIQMWGASAYVTPPSGVIFANNTIATSATIPSLQFINADTGCEVSAMNNILYGPSATTTTFSAGAGTISTANNLIDTDPLLADIADDMHITVGSPAIAYGLHTKYCLRDKDKVLRGSSVDAGSYEYV